MKCDFCSYEFTLKEIQQGAECPKCAAARIAESADRDARGSVAPTVRGALRDYAGAQPVVVVDIKMGFWSMVVFMVKWTLAAIPAFLILAAIGIFVVSFATGFIGSYGKYASKSAAESKADVQPVPEAADRVLTSPERIAVPGSVAGSFWLYKLGEVGGMVKMTVRTDFAGGSQSFSEFVVNCSAARGMIISVGSSAQEMRPDPGATGFEEIRPNTPRHAIAARGCRDRPDKHPTFK